MDASTFHFVQEIILLSLFSIVLPTLDIGTDVSFMVTLLGDNHPNWAFSLFVPFLANYLLSWAAWLRLEKQKLKTFLLPTFNIYPQYRAGKVISLFRRNCSQAKEKKKQFEREFSLTETMVESVPSVLLMTAIRLLSENSQQITGEPGSWRSQLFWISWLISWLSASLGLAKCLKIGVCSVMGKGGPLGGLLGGKFLLAMFSCSTVLITKGVMIARTTNSSLRVCRFYYFLYDSNSTNRLIEMCKELYPPNITCLALDYERTR